MFLANTLRQMMAQTAREKSWLREIRDAILEFRAIRLGKRALLAYQVGDMFESERLTRKALAIMENTFGDVHGTVVYVNQLAVLLTEQERYVEAEPLWRQTLAKHEKEFGPDHPSTRDAVSGLADVLRWQGVADTSSQARRDRCAEAEVLYRRLLDTRPAPAAHQRLIDPRDETEEARLASEVRTRNNLAQALTLQGKLAEAESSYQRAIEVSEAVVGPDDPNLGNILGNLANFYIVEQDDCAAAEPLFRRALAIFEAAGSEWNTELAATAERLGTVVARLAAEDNE